MHEDYQHMLDRRTAELGVSASDLEHLNRVFFADLHLCGCGNPQDAWALLHPLLRLLADATAGDRDGVAQLIGTPGACHMVLSWLDEARLSDHGGNVWGSWLTEKGTWVLATLDILHSHDVDELSLGVPHEGGPCTSACWTTKPGR